MLRLVAQFVVFVMLWQAAAEEAVCLSKLRSPVLFRGDAATAFRDPRVGKALMFFHGSDFPEGDPRGGFDNFASIGLAWSNDLKS